MILNGRADNFFVIKKTFVSLRRLEEPEMVSKIIDNDRVTCNEPLMLEGFSMRQCIVNELSSRRRTSPFATRIRHRSYLPISNHNDGSTT